jgi:hypothetical protein
LNSVIHYCLHGRWCRSCGGNGECSYSTSILYTVLAGTISLNRADFKAKVINSAEVLAIFGYGSGGAVSPQEVEMIDADASNTERYSPLECLVNIYALTRASLWHLRMWKSGI